MLRAIAIIIAEITEMLKIEMVAAAGAVLALSSFLVVTDASAAGRGGHGAGNHAVRTGGQIQRPTASKSGASRYATPNTNGGNFGMSGPYIGTKFIGNQ
jgi:hypothetical protein